jgi:hypothetical protein
MLRKPAFNSSLHRLFERKRNLRKETPQVMMQQELTALLGLLDVMAEVELKMGSSTKRVLKPG